MDRCNKWHLDFVLCRGKQKEEIEDNFSSTSGRDCMFRRWKVCGVGIIMIILNREAWQQGLGVKLP